MSEQPFNPEQFVSIQVYDSIFKTKDGDLSIIIEMRQQMNGETEIYTRIQDEEVRAKSIPDLILSRSDCVSLSITHVVPVMWNGATERTVLREVLLPDKQGSSHVSTRLILINHRFTRETSTCDSFTEAMMELDNIIDDVAVWHLKTCHSCKFSRPAFLWPVSDRDELRCYRDAPDALTELRSQGKFASSEALHAGEYFVNAFHRCSAWEIEE